MSRLSRREFLHAAAATLVGAGLSGTQTLCRRGGARRPNFVFFLTDDQRWDGMSCAGNPHLVTPNMDRLAGGGVRFENMFVTTSLCGPSRATYLTGLYAHNHGVRRNGMALAAKHGTFLERLSAAGYETAFIGKWHNLDQGRSRGLDYQFGFEGQGRYIDPVISENFGPAETYKGHVTDILADKAIRFIQRHHDRPFCLLVWFKAPHRSFQPAERFAPLYADVTIDEPSNFDDDYAGRPEAVKTANMRIGDFPDIPDFQTFVKDYYRCLAGVDENLGRILDAVESAGLYEDTAVIYAGDNGFFIGEHHFFDKRFMYEESIRVPLMIRYPRMVGPDRVDSRLIINADIAPTILDLAGVPLEDELDGASLKPILENRTVSWRRDFLYEYYEYPGAHSGRMCRGVRTHKWKYIHFFQEPQEFELYDLEADPHEMNNLIGEAAHRDVVRRLRSRMEELRKGLLDPDL